MIEHENYEVGKFYISDRFGIGECIKLTKCEYNNHVEHKACWYIDVKGCSVCSGRATLKFNDVNKYEICGKDVQNGRHMLYFKLVSNISDERW